jgi:hypothetical protein
MGRAPRLVVLAAGILLPGALSAEPNLPAGPRGPLGDASRGSAELSYSGFVAGLNVSTVRSAIKLGPDGYEMGVSFRTAGLVGAFVRAENIARVDGVWRGARAVPNRYESAGVYRGTPRQVEIDYPDGQPHIKVFQPPEETEHEPVPESFRQNTTDALSAIAMLVHTVATTGACEGSTATFDGRRASRIEAHTVGIENLPPESRSSFSGPALRCDIEGRQVAGFPFDAGPDDMVRKPQHSSVWLASVQPGMPPVPVLMSLEVRYLGHMTVYLTKAIPGAQLAQFTPRLP